MTKEKILPVNKIYVSIARKRLIKLYYAQRYLTAKERAKMVSFLRQIEKKITMLQHVTSIAEKILLKGFDS